MTSLCKKKATEVIQETCNGGTNQIYSLTQSIFNKIMQN